MKMKSMMNHTAMNMTGGGMQHNGSMMNKVHMSHNINGQQSAHMMQMAFEVGESLVLFFEEWTINSRANLTIACVFLAVLGILYEGLKVTRQYLLTTKSNKENNRSSRVSRVFSGWHSLQTLLHIVQIFIGYMLMLAFMTYNTWVCISVLIGSGIGYFIFGWITPMTYHGSDLGSHCN